MPALRVAKTFKQILILTLSLVLAMWWLPRVLGV